VLLAAAAPAGAQSTLEDPTPETETAIEIALHADGDATWTISYVMVLNGTNETEGFRSLGAQFADRESDPVIESLRRHAAAGSEATGRRMAIRNVARSWRVVPPAERRNGTGVPIDSAARGDQSLGVLRLRFEWTQFARNDGDDVVVGDVVTAGDGFLPRLHRGQTLVIHSPANYSVESASVGPVNGTLRWEGPTRFAEEDLTARFAPSGTNGPIGPGPPWADGLPLGVALALIVAGIALALHLRGSGASDDQPSADRPATPPQAGEAGGADSPAAGVDQPPASATEPPDDPFAGIDETLLSDAERVERVLEVSGGRMRQSQIVEATGWSNAKVSQVCSDMADEGRIEKLRIGRENLITLPDVDVFSGDESSDDGE
jgi:hypothetical protein